jgi:hypothetical protein
VITTVLWETFGFADRGRVADRLGRLLRDGRWNRDGIYAFWNPDPPFEVLYIGKASVPENNPAYRFREHTGLAFSQERLRIILNTPPEIGVGSKVREVFEYFDQHPGGEIGYSLGLHQPVPSDMTGSARRAAEAEAALLAYAIRSYRKLPQWNHRRELVDNSDRITQLLESVTDADECSRQLRIIAGQPSLSRAGKCICTLSANPWLQDLELEIDDLRIACSCEDQAFWVACWDAANRNSPTDALRWAIVEGYGAFAHWPSTLKKPYAKT